MSAQHSKYKQVKEQPRAQSVIYDGRLQQTVLGLILQFAFVSVQSRSGRPVGLFKVAIL